MSLVINVPHRTAIDGNLTKIVARRFCAVLVNLSIFARVTESVPFYDSTVNLDLPVIRRGIQLALAALQPGNGNRLIAVYLAVQCRRVPFLYGNKPRRRREIWRRYTAAKQHKKV